MNWQTFKNTLLENKEAPLQFEYAPQSFVNAAYHITEIKQAQITSVDCGGKMNAWTEVVVQLWVPADGDQALPMSAAKAMKIVDIVEKSLPLHPQAPVKIEYGNPAFPTQQMPIESILTESGELRVSLVGDTTQCKANERGGECGPKAKPKIQLVSIGESVEGESCTPGGGCC